MIDLLAWPVLASLAVIELGVADRSDLNAFERGFGTVALLAEIDASVEERLVALSIGKHESRWQTYSIDQTGRAFGPTQIENPALWGTSELELLGDPAAGYRVAIVMLREARRVCPGTWQRVLTVYVSGRCDIAPNIAREICGPVGLCEEGA